MEKIYPWQSQLWQHFLTQKPEFPTTLLLTGENSTGKTVLLKNLAQLILCEKTDKNPCENCLNCQWFKTGTHPDFTFLTGKEGILKVDQIRELKSWLTLTPHQQNRVIIIDAAEQLNIAAQNSLLKILEEPPKQVFFLLNTSQPNSLLPTILSRCQQFHLQITDQIIREWFLQEKLPNEFLWLKETPLKVFDYLDRYGKLLPLFLSLLKSFITDPCQFIPLQKVQNQIDLLDLIKLYYELNYELLIHPEIPITKWIYEYSLKEEKAFAFEQQLLQIQKTLQQRISLNTSLISENLALSFVQNL